MEVILYSVIDEVLYLLRSVEKDCSAELEVVLVDVWLDHEILVEDLPGVCRQSRLLYDHSIDETRAHEREAQVEYQKPRKYAKLPILSQRAQF